jgi:hypothetical protein
MFRFLFHSVPIFFVLPVSVKNLMFYKTSHLILIFLYSYNNMGARNFPESFILNLDIFRGESKEGLNVLKVKMY